MHVAFCLFAAELPTRCLGVLNIRTFQYQPEASALNQLDRFRSLTEFA
jgi:hypothetical protein